MDIKKKNLLSAILYEIEKAPGVKAKDIANNLGVDKKIINRYLYSELSKFVKQTDDYNWRLSTSKQENEHMDDREMPEENSNFALDSLQAIRNRLLDLTGRNRLLNFRHSNTGLIRIIDEMPDQLASSILDSNQFTFIPVDEPRKEELIEHGYIIVDEDGDEQRVKPNPNAKEWAKVKGLNTGYELPLSVNSNESKHNDTNIQSLLFPRELEAQLRRIRNKANSAIEETGANILYIAFGFLEWFEDENSQVGRQAPLFLIPVRIERASLNKKLGTYTYTVEHTGEDIISNLSLREKLKHDFQLGLPEIEEDVLPENYIKLVAEQISIHKPAWSVKRFATLAMFDFGKLLMYLDLDPKRWPTGKGNIKNHAILQRFFATQGEERDSADLSSFANEYPIDNLENVHDTYPLIDDADSSQHSALVDAIKGKNLVIEGPPGSGKSQTITNLIAAAISQGKRVLFVAEKMAALQVVKRRLSKAGLGDFCLELHSNKTQKKLVYENIQKRIKNQHNYRYPVSIDMDIKMYEDKKDKLTTYAKLINSQWKASNKTIHEIFTAATRYREEFSDIAVEEVRVDGFSGDKFDEFESRKTVDDLERYIDVYNEIKAQIGSESDISDHPWFGVYNKSIQVFDADEICQLLSNFDQATELVIIKMEEISTVIGEDIPKIKRNVKSLSSDLKKLPENTGLEDLEAIPNLTFNRTKELKAYINRYASAHNLMSTITEIFEPEVVALSDAYEDYTRSLEEVSEKLKLDHLTPTNIFENLTITIAYKELFESISTDMLSIIEQEPSLTNLLVPSINGIAEFDAYLKHIDSLDSVLVSRRDPIFDNDALDTELTELSDILQEMKPLHKKLEAHYDLKSLLSMTELKHIKTVMQEAGLFKWFSGEWRTAKSKLISKSISLKPKLSVLFPLLSDLIRYTELNDKLERNNKYATLLKHEYNGVFTEIEDLVSLRTWYANVRRDYGIGFGKRVLFADSILKLPDTTFKGIQHLASSKTSSCLEQFNDKYNKLVKVFASPIFDDKDLHYTSGVGIDKFSNDLEKTTQHIQSSIKNDYGISELKNATNKLTEFLLAESKLIQENLPHQIFAKEVTLLPREECSEKVNIIRATLDLYEGINKLETKPLKSFLLSIDGTKQLEVIRSYLQQFDPITGTLEHTYREFKERVKLDAPLWFKTSSGDLEQWRHKNALALSHPRWLSTWVDFIRIREILTSAGLENLLRKTELGEIELENIKSIYSYAVFDSLAREVITENQELAYFSGADQNAVRKQFTNYDNKLKELQQEKIAYQVAQHGWQNLKGGVSSGKVASYTEMGLINNEVNKKTRHVPLRQLVKRAGQSLVALKPCFMMGPHSVAQYLEPGAMDFDLIVMDEASQIKPEDSLGTIARGKQLVVVGDPKQLPPTSFFDKAVETDYEDSTAIEQSESILDVSLPMFNARRLRWHYRSRHESLIAFSNQEFYDGNLVVFPSPSFKSDEFGIKFIHVKHGRFVNQQNIEEAKLVAQAVKRHVINSVHESLGIVAMSSKQRDQIERCVEELSKDDALFRDALAENAESDEPLFIKNLENVQGDERDVIYISCTYGPQEAGDAQMPQRFGPINSAAGGRRLNVLFTRSKKRMHVFSSMTESHILASDNANPGVHALKNFLSFAQTGRLSQLKHTNKEPDSDFEISVINALKLEGFSCVPQVGVAGYFIDIAVQDPGQPGRYMMGIECDGATYHSAKSARDRDRLRQSVLENLGWEIKRIWSTDWFKNPQAQLKPIIERLNQLKTEVKEQPQKETEMEQIQADIEEESQRLQQTDSISHSEDTLESKLQKFAKQVIANAVVDVPKNNSLLRAAMIDALCEFKPISKSEFLEKIPAYLRNNVSPKHGEFLEQVLNIIAEDEEENII